MKNEATVKAIENVKSQFPVQSDAMCATFQKLAAESDTFVDWITFWFVDEEAVRYRF